MEATSSSASEGPHLRTIAMPRDTNAAGAIFGGWTVSQMDLAGGTLVAQRTRACRRLNRLVGLAFSSL